MSELYKKAKNHFEQNLPFVIYCKPNSDKTIGIFQHNDFLHSLDETTESGFAIVSFDNEKRYLIPESISDIYFEKNDFSSFIISNIKKEKNFEVRSSFENLVKNGVEAIKRNEFEKVVLSRKEIVETTAFDFEISFKKLLQNYGSAFNYCFYHPKVGFWMGATPEQFLKIDNDTIKTVSLAGTQIFENNLNTNWSTKEIEEQKIVTDYIVSNLNNFTQDVIVTQPYTFLAGTLVHIKTDIEAKNLSEKDTYKIINALHPTPAVCGFPKDIAKKYIIEKESFEGFHIHTATKRYQEFGLKREDVYAQITDRFDDYENALKCLLEDCNFTVGIDPQMNLFGGSYGSN